MIIRGKPLCNCADSYQLPAQLSGKQLICGAATHGHEAWLRLVSVPCMPDPSEVQLVVRGAAYSSDEHPCRPRFAIRWCLSSRRALQQGQLANLEGYGNNNMLLHCLISAPLYSLDWLVMTARCGRS